jgi:hypothetical protein
MTANTFLRQDAIFAAIAQGDLPFDPAPITATLGADVLLNNTANFFTGPTIAQGSVGTWYVSGTVTLIDTIGDAQFLSQLWDGSTVIASGAANCAAANNFTIIALSGVISAPAGNLRISCKDVTSTSGKIAFSAGSNSSTITAFRIK